VGEGRLVAATGRELLEAGIEVVGDLRVAEQRSVVLRVLGEIVHGDALGPEPRGAFKQSFDVAIHAAITEQQIVGSSVQAKHLQLLVVLSQYKPSALLAANHSGSRWTAPSTAMMLRPLRPSGCLISG
jgi:hypothetical protein